MQPQKPEAGCMPVHPGCMEKGFVAVYLNKRISTTQRRVRKEEGREGGKETGRRERERTPHVPVRCQRKAW